MKRCTFVLFYVALGCRSEQTFFHENALHGASPLSTPTSGAPVAEEFYQQPNTIVDALFVIDVGYHKIAIAEAQKLGIPIIGVVDSNHSPEGIDYVIPGNDDSAKAVTLYARGIADAILDGRANAMNDVQRAVAEGAGGNDEFVEVREGSPA